MKISLIDPVGGHGGMDYYDYGLAQGLGGNDVLVDYFTCNNTIHRDFKNVSLFRTFGNIWCAKGLRRGYFFFRGYIKAFQNSRKNGSHVFHLHFFNLGLLNLSVLMIAFFFKQRKVVTLHDVNSFHVSSNRLIERLSMFFIDGIIVHNLASRTALVKKKLSLPKLEVIPHGNYLHFVSMLPIPKNKEKMNLLFFGQIKEVKGLDILLKALVIVVKKNANFKLTIAGRPWKTDGDHYEKMVMDLGLDNYVERHFRFIQDNEVADLYKKADVVILPYKRIYQSGVLLLTWSYGRTVIASNLDPFTELITNFENGFLFESENPDNLASSILKLNHKDILRTTLNSRKLIKNKFDWTKIGQQTLNFYRTL
ncbi:glycosyltransferase family 4 protein [Ulvibacterium sp.]|uniref:glycosyltransferase family 4 protein n=1 Tax=Ulvibacterium sp. TaxID=2665914 RepID=UPI003BADA150